ncbi:MAG TPA: rhodanese-like domain-containing protein [Xanthomonadales bacterium]|nr:rhodanese-like domain-containing protein [Xanthomonadales bacterium]
MLERLPEFIANHIVLSAIFVALLVMLVGNEISRLLRKYKALTPSQLTLLINRDNPLLIDVGARADYEAGHIVGAKHVAMSQFDPESKDLAKVKDLPVAVYCKTGQASAQAAERLAKAGFTKVHWLDGGLQSWQASDYPLVKGKA